MSEGKLQDTERVQQSEITRSLANETLQFEQSLREQLLSQRQMLALTGWIQNVDDPSHAPQLARMLQVFVENNPDILYVTAVNKEAKGPSAGSVSADRDPFVEAAWKRAFTSSMQGFDSLSEPFALGQENRPALVMSVPLLADGQFAGMLSAVVSLDRLQARLHDASVRDRKVYIVNVHGQIVAYPDARTDGSGARRHLHFAAREANHRTAAGIARHANLEFLAASTDGRHPIEMIGTYSTIPELGLGGDRAAQPGRRACRRGRQRVDRRGAALRRGRHVHRAALGYLFALRITRTDSQPGRIRARHQPRGIPRARGRPRRRRNRRARGNVQQHGGRYRGVRRAA